MPRKVYIDNFDVESNFRGITQEGAGKALDKPEKAGGEITTKYTVTLVESKTNKVLDEVEVDGKEAAYALVKQKVDAYVTEGWKVVSDDLPSTYTSIAKGKQERQFIINEGTMRQLDEAEEGGEGHEMVSVEVHIEFAAEPEDVESGGGVLDFMNNLMDNAEGYLEDNGLKGECHLLTGARVLRAEAVSEPGVEGEKPEEARSELYNEEMNYVVGKLEKVVLPKGWKSKTKGENDLAEAVCAFVAYDSSQQMVEGNNRRDWMEVFMEGIPAVPKDARGAVEYEFGASPSKEEADDFVVRFKDFLKEG